MIPRPGAGPDPPGPGARTSLAAAPAAYRLLVRRSCPHLATTSCTPAKPNCAASLNRALCLYWLPTAHCDNALLHRRRANGLATKLG